MASPSSWSPPHNEGTARPVGTSARGEWHTTVLVRPSVEGEEAGGLFHPGAEPGESGPARRLCAWRESAPRITDIEDPELHRTLRRSPEDLGALRIFDPRHPEHTAVAAGAPWFMALFGRDSLLSSYMALPLDPAHHGERRRQAVGGRGHRRPCAGAGRVGVAGLQGGRAVRRNTAAKGYDAWMRRNSSVPSPSAPD
ncbi:hypothetical protein ACFWDI_27470 [Streptomyces sp. NPDC060064]|uniref:hypothetical protein n=1 Tax=Streptomyces sp. NPDC060064 TaxID=3347049 RepID=UPI00369C39E0